MISAIAPHEVRAKRAEYEAGRAARSAAADLRRCNEMVAAINNALVTTIDTTDPEHGPSVDVDVAKAVWIPKNCPGKWVYLCYNDVDTTTLTVNRDNDRVIFPLESAHYPARITDQVIAHFAATGYRAAVREVELGLRHECPRVQYLEILVPSE